MSVSILGTGITSFGRRPDDNMRSLSQEALGLALTDAGITASDLNMVVFGNAADGFLHGQEMIRSEVALRHAGLAGVPMINVENACASSSSAFDVACMAVASGTADVVLVMGVERLTHPTKRRSFDALATAVDLHEHTALASTVGATGAPPEVEGSSHSPLMDLYAAKARSFMERSGVTAEDLALVSVKNRFHGSLNPKAQFQTPVEVEDVMASRMISDPLRMLMCSPIGDGAAAVIVASSDYVKRAGKPDVRVAGWALTSNGADPRAAQPVARAMDIALTRAQLSALGATGCAQLIELADQLRGRGGARQVAGARVGLAQNSGGILDDLDEAVAAVTILTLKD
ncbi:thiolase family protein [Rhodococcus sp. YH3-3]|uniref:thiolase family protein n=1 Tax=Rhodococcus sp. YH3-3 TaxID=1803579 RepID=UPI0007DAFC4B|nr:thiolase family protein [Rhodococcus sp. YH3-3]